MVPPRISTPKMNFPENQKTGVLAEIDVERLFTSWSWNVGKDRIDVGYDLFVMPDHAQYQGARFLVQVKGTAQKKKKGIIVAPVSKDRLRQYAEDCRWERPGELGSLMPSMTTRKTVWRGSISKNTKTR